MDNDLIEAISKYIESCSDGNYNSVIANDKRFEIMYNLAETRQALFSWYPFKKGAKLLEFGGEFGALTGLFCEKCKVVTTLVDNKKQADIIKKRHKKFDNLEVKIGYYIEELNIKYDYIVILDKMAYMCSGSKRVTDYIEKLKNIVEFLKEDGTLLIATDNRYGLKYFCGEREPITHVPFAGLNRYLEGSDGYMFSKNELITIVNNLHNMKCKFYYPLPDYKFPQLIYTDNILPDKELKERLINYSLDKSSLIMAEKRLYEDIIENKVFPFFSNSFLIECNRKNIFSDINCSILSVDREHEHGFVTTIHENGEVRKKSAYKEGKENVKLLVDNVNNIAKHGVLTVKHELIDDSVVMPYIKLPTLSKCLINALKKDLTGFLNLFDLLYEEILKSSEQVELKDSNCFFINSNPEYWGPILKKSYIDMIPVNCFFDGKNLIFFDQEFVKENFPAGYTMFRAIYYTYSFIHFANGLVPLKEMKARYNLAQTWEYYKEIENQFVAKTRDFSTYGEFWKLRGVNDNQIKENVKRLMN